MRRYFGPITTRVLRRRWSYPSPPRRSVTSAPTRARDLLGLVAFFPQGIDENNLEWLFPAISNRSFIFDKFCVLSLTHRSNGFITMLALIRGYLCPPDPRSSPLLRSTKDRYFARLSVNIYPGRPGFEEGKWIVTEDVNVEHLLDFFASVDTESGDVWKACVSFLRHLYWHTHRYTMLGPKIEGLPDDHRFKSKCLIQLSQLSQSIGNFVEQKRLLTQSLKLERGRERDFEVARILRRLSISNMDLQLYREGIQQAREAVGVYERLGNTVEQANCWIDLARLLEADNQLDAAEVAGSRAINLLPKKGKEFLVCQSHRALGNIYCSKNEREKAIHHFEMALDIASLFKWQSELCWINHSLGRLFLDQGKFDDATTHIE